MILLASSAFKLTCRTVRTKLRLKILESLPLTSANAITTLRTRVLLRLSDTLDQSLVLSLRLAFIVSIVATITKFTTRAMVPFCLET